MRLCLIFMLPVRRSTVVLMAILFFEKTSVWSIGDLCYMDRCTDDKTLRSHGTRCSVSYSSNWTILFDKSYNLYSIVLTLSVANEAKSTSSFSNPEDQASSFGSYAVILQTSDDTKDKKKYLCNGRIAQSHELIGNLQRFQSLNETIDCRYYYYLRFTLLSEIVYNSSLS